MSLKNYLKVISDKKIFILVTVIICGVLAFVISSVKPQSYDSGLLLTVHRENREETKDFQYDNYYSIQASEYLSNTAVSLIESPEFVSKVYNRAGLADELDDVFAAAKKIKPKQISSHLIKVKLNDKDEEKAKKLSIALGEVLKDDISKIEISAAGKGSFTIAAEEPIVTLKKYNPWLVGLIGMIGGLFIGIALAFLGEYFRREEGEEKKPKDAVQK
jgi:capsular polysaccharide biosynthesis protein